MLTMSALIGKTPFFRLLLPVIAGIAVSSLFPGISFLILPAGLLGLLLMLLSFFIKKEHQFKQRWLFGAGALIFLFSLSVFQYKDHEQRARFTFSGTEHAYIAAILDIPEAKPRSIACNVKTTHPMEKKVILYLEQTDEARSLGPGDEIIFSLKLQPFRNLGNPDDFDYARFMKNKGFAGSGYVSAANWRKTGRQSLTIPILAQRFRAKALDFYRSFQLNPDAYAFISALTLGHQAGLSDDLQEAFRASGTAHVLSVSGLHVGIIYMIINLMFSFLGTSGKQFVIRQWLVILLLWGYAFVTGMAAPVVRSAIMLTIFCFGNMQHHRGFTYNTLAAAAFFILIFRPLNLFDVSFQMSFTAIAAILYFQPKLRSLYTPTNKAVKYIWDLFTVSTAAQLGVFPLVLHYFGTFPTYFFITNLLIVPLTGVIMYAVIPVIIVGVPGFLQSGFLNILQTVFQWILKTLIEITLRIVYFSETLPFAELSDRNISFFQLVLLFTCIYLFARFLFTHRPKPLIIALISVLAFLLTITHEILTKAPPQLVVFNSAATSHIGVFADNKRHPVEIPGNGFLPHPDKRIFRLSDGSPANVFAEERFPLDVLILSQYRYFNTEQLLGVFHPKMIVLDSSLPRSTADRLAKECRLLGVGVHDVTQKGAFSINF
jgi:ComEC/Rec2-related protein